MVCPGCQRAANEDARFCSGCGRPLSAPRYVAAPQGRLVRPLEERMIAGVCSGIALHMGWDVTLVRIATVALVFLGCGTAIPAYLIAWVVIPNGYLMLPAGMPGTVGPVQGGVSGTGTMTGAPGPANGTGTPTT